jgi:hypothetical protein
MLSIPSAKAEGQPDCVFMMLKSMLSRHIAIYLMTRDESLPTLHPLPNTVIGFAENIDMSLKTIL